MKKIMFGVLAILLLAGPAMAGKLTAGSTDKGQFTDLKVTRAVNSTVNGNEATIDLATLSQASTTAAEPVITLVQADVDQPLLTVSCTEGALNTCSCYTATGSTKVGAIQVKIGSTTRWLRLYDQPN